MSKEPGTGGSQTLPSHAANQELPEDDEGIWRLATALSAAATPHDVAIALAEHGPAAADASFSNLAILNSETGQVSVEHNSKLSTPVAARWTEFNYAEHTPLCEAMRTGQPVLLASLDEIGQSYPGLLADTVQSSLQATASLPLPTASGKMLGAAGFGWEQEQSFTPAQNRRLELIANMAAQALDRAVLYARERDERSAEDRALAHLLQDAFLPREMPRSDTLDLAAVYLPARDAAMGGDWYDAFPVDGGICLVIGDVAGHGVQSASVMAQLRHAVRAFADEDSSPSRVLTRLNRMLCRLEPNETASAIVAVWDADAGTITRSNAGHPPVLRCRAGETAFLPAPRGRLLLGVQPEWEYGEEVKVLRPGTTLLFYTDGLVEMRGASLDEGMTDLLMLVEGLPNLSPQALCDDVIEWRLKSARREDDICLLAARLT